MSERHPLAEEPALEGGTWVSPKGVPFTGVERVNLDLLAQAYAAETDYDVPEPKLDPATRNAWQLGYRNPRLNGGPR